MGRHVNRPRRASHRIKRNPFKKTDWIRVRAQKKTVRFAVTAVARAVRPVPGHPTSSPQPTDKSYKQGTYRLHWKGYRNLLGQTSGNQPHIGTRDKKRWKPAHDATRRQLGKLLRARVVRIVNPFGKHLAENSHIHAGSLFGPNDVLSAPPASIHQNTEWLAIESGIKSLQRLGPAALGGDLRVKSTGYVHASSPLAGTLKAARYKVYIGGRKVFDHVAMGDRGNIDANEASALQARVEGLRSTSATASLGTQAPKGVHGAAPTLAEARAGQRTHGSATHPQFTDLQTTTGARLTGDAALHHADSRYTN